MTIEKVNDLLKTVAEVSDLRHEGEQLVTNLTVRRTKPDGPKDQNRNSLVKANQNELFQKHQQEIQETKNKLAEQEAKLMGAVKAWQKENSIGKWTITDYEWHGSTQGAAYSTKELYMVENIIYEFQSHNSTEATPMGTMLELILIKQKIKPASTLGKAYELHKKFLKYCEEFSADPK